MKKMLCILLPGFLFASAADCALPQKPSTPTTYEKLKNFVWIPLDSFSFLDSVENWNSSTTEDEKRKDFDKINEAFEKERKPTTVIRGSDKCLAYALRIPGLRERISDRANFLSPQLLLSVVVAANSVLEKVAGDTKCPVSLLMLRLNLNCFCNMVQRFLKDGETESAGVTLEDAYETYEKQLIQIKEKMDSISCTSPQYEVCEYLGHLDTLVQQLNIKVRNSQMADSK